MTHAWADVPSPSFVSTHIFGRVGMDRDGVFGTRAAQASRVTLFAPSVSASIALRRHNGTEAFAVYASAQCG